MFTTEYREHVLFFHVF